MFPIYPQFYASYTEPVARGERCVLDALAVYKGSIRTGQVHDLQMLVAGGEAAVQPRHQRGIDDEVGARRAADRLDRSRTKPERHGVGVRRRSLKNPHGAYLINCLAPSSV